MLLITKVSRGSSLEGAATALATQGQALIAKLQGSGIDISTADQPTQAKYGAIDKHQPTLHPTCALWFARQCLARGDKDLFCEVVTTFRLKRLQGIVENANIVAESLHELPSVHQIEFAPGCVFTKACVDGLKNALSQFRKAPPFELNLHGCAIELSVLKALATALPSMTSLAMLSISKPALSGAPCDTGLGAAIGGSPHLLAFKLDVPAVAQKAAEAIGKGIRQNRSLIEVHFCTDASIECPQWLMAELARPDAIDPTRPGLAAPALATLVLVGDRGKHFNLVFSEACTEHLAKVLDNNPLLTRVRIEPFMEFHEPRTCQDLFAICKTRPICLDIRLVFNGNFARAYPRMKDTDPRYVGMTKPLRPTLNFLRRTSPAPLLRPELAREGAATVLAALLHLDGLEADLCPLIAEHVQDQRTLAALRCINKAAVEATRRFHLAFQVNLVKSLPHSFGDIEFAHHMMGPPLAGLSMSDSPTTTLQSSIDALRPDAARLRALMDSEGRRMLGNWKEQELLLINYHFAEQFQQDHARLEAFRKLFPQLKGKSGDISMKHLSFEVGLLKTEEDVKRSVKKAFGRIPKLLTPRKSKDSDPSSPPKKKD
jgi:hypothetical protein